MDVWRHAEGLPWRPDAAAVARLDALARVQRRAVHDTLGPLVAAWYPEWRLRASGEFDKMIELSTKMTMVGHACAGAVGVPFDARRQRIAALYGGCCFLADSFIDNFGVEQAREYLRRFSELFATGWFEVRTERERLFYVTAALLFAELDMLAPVVRQAVLSLHGAQSFDAMLRIDPTLTAGLTRRERRLLLRRVARDRGGHTILLLTALVVPSLPLELLAGLFSAGALFMFIDDHGDAMTDRREGRATYLNQLRDPERALRRIVDEHIRHILEGLPESEGRDDLLAILTRYYVTRVEKHREQRARGGTAWDVYE